MAYNFIQKFIVEGRKDKLIQLTLPYADDELAPVKSKETIEYHYGTLYQGYVDRYNKGEGEKNILILLTVSKKNLKKQP
jgi:superoxide dismutase